MNLRGGEGRGGDRRVGREGREQRPRAMKGGRGGVTRVGHGVGVSIWGLTEADPPVYLAVLHKQRH